MPLRHRTLSSLGSILFLVVLIAPCGVAQTEPHPLQLASLRPQQELRWHRLSPNSENPDGPVLYQLLFNASGTPGTIAKFDSNPRHLANSLITDNGSIVAIGSLSIDNTGLITFKSGQSFLLPAAVGDVSGTFPNLTVTKLQGIAVANTAPVSGQVLGFNGTTWAPATLSGGGTVTSVGSGLGLSGGPITTSGMLAIDANVVPQLGAANSFSGLNLFGGGAQLPPAGTATPSQGFNSNAFDLFASAYNTTAGNPVNQKFRWQAEPVNNNTASTSATLNLLFSVGAAAPAETGLSIASNGQVTFASGQNFPASGITLAGDVTGAAAATTVGKLRGISLSAASPADGQALVYSASGTAWA